MPHSVDSDEVEKLNGVCEYEIFDDPSPLSTAEWDVFAVNWALRKLHLSVYSKL